ncbi:lycopene cyclase family protein [Ammonicoccus fulvus]|uniref:Lycopene cyclase family protein n=1 Tax=Ammonicoccus fulvus TaxID=3138240 RepID=A0ABZ3FN47_9ACTN
MAAVIDVAIVGLGPAGRALAAHCLRRGLSVLAVDPRPDAVWRPTYGVWVDEVADLPETVFRSRVRGPEVRAAGIHRLERTYGILDNRRLREALSLEGATIRETSLSDTQVATLRGEARVVVDARGARPARATSSSPGRAEDAAPAQTAYGIVVPSVAAAPALEGAPALLMDWRTDWAERFPPRGPASFLYAIPLGDDRVLLEETCLAAAPAYPIGELEARLRRRLLARGVARSVIDDPIERETVFIPMRGRAAVAPPGILAIGTAGRGGNVVTGYSVAHSLATAPRLATRLATGDSVTEVDPSGPADSIRDAGLRALLALDVAGTMALFDAFGALPPGQQKSFMSRSSSAFEVARSMWGMFARMPIPGRRALVRATLGPRRQERL